MGEDESTAAAVSTAISTKFVIAKHNLANLQSFTFLKVDVLFSYSPCDCLIPEWIPLLLQNTKLYAYCHTQAYRLLHPSGPFLIKHLNILSFSHILWHPWLLRFGHFWGAKTPMVSCWILVWCWGTNAPKMEDIFHLTLRAISSGAVALLRKWNRENHERGTKEWEEPEERGAKGGEKFWWPFSPQWSCYPKFLAASLYKYNTLIQISEKCSLKLWIC